LAWFLVLTCLLCFRLLVDDSFAGDADRDKLSTNIVDKKTERKSTEDIDRRQNNIDVETDDFGIIT
jgi:hypothetical protein